MDFEQHQQQQAKLSKEQQPGEHIHFMHLLRFVSIVNWIQMKLTRVIYTIKNMMIQAFFGRSPRPQSTF
jgi:ribosome biogenesis protein Nip4